MEKKNITIVTLSLSNNGAERVFSELANEWDRLGHNVTVIQLERNAFGVESFVLNDNVELMTLNHIGVKNKIKRYVIYLKDLRKYFKEHPDHTIIAYSATTQILVWIASKKCKNKIIFSERNDPNRVPYSRVFRILRNVSFCKADRIVFQTNDAAHYFKKSIQKKGIVIANPIRNNLPKPYVGTRRKVIITAARLRPQKNLPMLIDAFSDLYLLYPDYKLYIYGVGELHNSLISKISEMHLENAVFLQGFSSEIDSLMNDCTMYVCSSDYEGISNSMLEAIAMGVPTISTDCPIGGARQTIKNGYNGLLVPVGDTEALTDAMKKIIRDNKLEKKISQNGTKLRDEYSVNQIGGKWIDII